jgi:enamine deaminase RidA (YjgF/YER057c/UK114 family)
MTITRIDQGKRMSQAVVANGMVYLAGQVGTGDGAAEQTRTALAEIERLLAAAGSDKTKLVSALICLADIADFDAMNSVWDPWIADVGAPARATIEARLAGPQYLIEIIVVATL